MKIIQKFSGLMLILVGLMMFYCAYSNWQMDQEFAASAKGRSLGTVHIDRSGVQTINFPENSYGVAMDDKDRKEGEQVYIYYQKNKPYRISTTSNHYGTKSDIYKPILGGIFFIFYVFLTDAILPHLAKKFTKKNQLLES